MACPFYAIAWRVPVARASVDFFRVGPCWSEAPCLSVLDLAEPCWTVSVLFRVARVRVVRVGVGSSSCCANQPGQGPVPGPGLYNGFDIQLILYVNDSERI